MPFDSLPPLHLLLAFEAAGRLGSFKAAAAQLHVTPSAISHQMKELELALAKTLFERHGRAIRLTREGGAYLREVQRALAEIAGATRRLRDRSASRVLRLTSDNFVAYEFLLPRLADFRACFPDVELSLVPTTRLVDLATEDIHAAIRIGVRPWAGLVAHVLGEAWVTPVCSPSLAADIHTLAQLTEHPLIELRGQRRGWHRFLEKHQAPAPRTMLGFDGYLETMHAAEQGLGIAFGVFPMTTEWVLQHRLAAPLAVRSALAADVCVLYRETDDDDPLYRALTDWVRGHYAALPALPPGRVVGGCTRDSRSLERSG